MKKTLTVMTLTALMCSAAPAFAISLTGTDYNAKAQYYMTQIDTDKDGKISKAEHEAYADKMFTAADANGDGYVTMDELVAAKKKEAKDESSATGMTSKMNTAKKDFSSMKNDLMSK
jgi:Ca2+-binding EF-hand superfamily protein